MTRKAEAPVQPRQALEVQLRKSVFDFNSWTEATRGARRWSWTEEKRKRLSSPDKQKAPGMSAGS